MHVVRVLEVQCEKATGDHLQERYRYLARNRCTADELFHSIFVSLQYTLKFVAVFQCID